jgi:hypothetical protein
MLLISSLTIGHVNFSKAPWGSIGFQVKLEHEVECNGTHAAGYNQMSLRKEVDKEHSPVARKVRKIRRYLWFTLREALRQVFKKVQCARNRAKRVL